MIAARRRKMAAVLAVAALASGLLSACQTRVGAAAYVGSTRISESTVNGYVNRSATVTYNQNTGAPQSPKSQVLNSLIISDLLDRVFATVSSGPPTPSDMAAARAVALGSIGAPSLAALQTGLESSGFSKSFASVYLDEQAKVQLLEEQLKDTDGSVLLKQIGKLPVKVSVSPRYGDWDQSQVSLSAGPSLPSYLTLANDGTTGDSTSG